MKNLAVRALQRSALLHDVYVKIRFPVERQLLEGTHVSDSLHPSIIHFSVNRSATQYVRRILRQLAKENGITPADLSHYSYSNDMPYLDHLTAEQMEVYKHVFKPKGYIYSPFGGFVHGIPDLEKYLIVLVIRDPRDVVTSLYYSMAFSHRLPDRRDRAEAFLADRQRIRQMSVDEFVLQEIGRFCGRYRIYMKELHGRRNVLVTRYEDMINDFPQWLEAILEFCSLSCHEATRAKLIAEASESSKSVENKMSHKRQVIPGDHRRKLKPETIVRLDAELADVLSRYGYR
jgi:hypothetical protein